MHRAWTEDRQAVLEKFNLNGGGRSVVAMSDAIVYHLRDNPLIDFEGVIRLCAEGVPPDAEVEFLFDEFDGFVGIVEEVSLKPFI